MTDPAEPRDETYRAVITVRTPDPKVATTVIVTRQGLGKAGRTWVTLHGSIRATAVLTDDEVSAVQLMLTAAMETRP